MNKPSIPTLIFFALLFSVCYGLGGVVVGTPDSTPMRSAWDCFFGYLFASLYWIHWAPRWMNDEK